MDGEDEEEEEVPANESGFNFEDGMRDKLQALAKAKTEAAKKAAALKEARDEAEAKSKEVDEEKKGSADFDMFADEVSSILVIL